MGLDIAVQSESFPGNEDRSWAKARLGFDTCRSITLDVSTFAADHLTAKGAIPSGTVLGEITATHKYGPYGGSASEVQQIAVDATAGTFTVTVEGEVTAAVAFNVSAANLQAALNNLSNVEPGDITVTGGPGSSGGGTPYILTFGGNFVGDNVPAVVATDVNLTGGGDAVTVTTNTAGGSAVADGREVAAGLLFNTTRVGPLMGAAASGSLVNLATAADVGAPLMWQGIVSRSKLPVFANTDAGQIDAAAEARLVHIRFEA